MKRHYGSGSAFEEKKNGQLTGRWIVQWDLPPLDGKRRRRQLRADTEAAAWKRMRDAQHQAPRSKSPARPASGSVGAFLERWLDGVVASTRRERTLVGYRAIVRNLAPDIRDGTDLLDKDLPHLLQAWINGLPLHPRTVHHYAACLRAAFAYATKKGLMDRNPAVDLDLPAIPRVERIPLTAAQLRQLLDFTGGGRVDSESDGSRLGSTTSSEGLSLAATQARALGLRDVAPAVRDPLHPLWVTAAWTGMRQGELLALRWQDVNLDRASLVVRGSLARLPGPKGTRYVITDPKTERSRRTVPLVPEVVEVLRDLRKAQLAAEKPAGYLDQGLVFCTPNGRALNAANVARWFGNAVRGAGLPKINFHMLRHGCATLWIEHGIDLPTIADLLGHSTITTTVSFYAHLTEGHRRAAIDRFWEAVG